MTSIIKVNNLQNQCGANIINENAGTITIGASGDTVTLAAGASQSGFGRAGSVNWDTTPKTTPLTAVSGNGYFIDTTSGAITVTLPATPSAGDIVAIADYDGTALTNNITVGRNSSDINGAAADLTITQNYSAVTLVYVDATTGWRSVDSSNPNDIAVQPEYIAATGGTITCDGDFKVHTFTGPGTFTVTSVGNPLGSTTVDYMVVAGGGAGGGIGPADSYPGGGGGAGGFRESSGTASGCYSASPLGSGVSALPVSAQGYPIVVGSGGGSDSAGNNSVFSTITSAGGGKGQRNGAGPGINGGSGGGSSYNQPNGSGNTPPTSPPQGNNGGNNTPTGGFDTGGGGGATAVGGAPGSTNGNGGAGATTSISGSSTAYAGGGGGGSHSADTTAGGSGVNGGGNGASYPTLNGSPGTANTGGGGGGAGRHSGVATGNGGTGGSGIVIIRYKFQ
jgi:hypothetical protein